MPPLSERLRPKTLNDVIGQSHLLGKEGFISKIILSKKPVSLLLFGPPGSGKTTIAKLYASAFELPFENLSAVFSSISEIKKLAEEAQSSPLFGSSLLLFVDEIHRFNKAQQDAFLPYIEQGTLILIGATTENPSFSLNSALLSRLNVLTLNPLTTDDLLLIIARYEKLIAPLPLSAAEKKHLAELAHGDGRYLLNLLENLEKFGSYDQKTLKNLLKGKAALYDKHGEYHYNLISALHKAIRGSDPDAALYWFCRMLEGGEDPLYIARRLVRMASEDVGLSDPEALSLALKSFQTFQMLGSPEGDLALAETVIYLALAPKSNALYTAYQEARKTAQTTGHLPPPMHILNAPTKLMQSWGYGQNYLYDHDTKEGFSGQNYFPDQLKRTVFYHPVERGFERELKKRLEYFQKLREKKKTEAL
ncbi:MAG: replication-associated recombination protein A [Parachlamydiales bacterium]|jgi:putative ATPase